MGTGAVGVCRPRTSAASRCPVMCVTTAEACGLCLVEVQSSKVRGSITHVRHSVLPGASSADADSARSGNRRGLGMAMEPRRAIDDAPDPVEADT